MFPRAGHSGETLGCESDPTSLRRSHLEESSIRLLAGEQPFTADTVTLAAPITTAIQNYA
jgi:hypothetical protein